jgi:hypothetical protein
MTRPTGTWTWYSSPAAATATSMFPEHTYENMRRAFAKGEFFNANVRDHYRYAQLN